MRTKRLGKLSVREEADRCISYSVVTRLECVDGGRINNTLVNMIPSLNNTLRKEIKFHVQATSVLGKLGSVTSGSAVAHQSKHAVKTDS